MRYHILPITVLLLSFSADAGRRTPNTQPDTKREHPVLAALRRMVSRQKKRTELLRKGVPAKEIAKSVDYSHAQNDIDIVKAYGFAPRENSEKGQAIHKEAVQLARQLDSLRSGSGPSWAAIVKGNDRLATSGGWLRDSPPKAGAGFVPVSGSNYLNGRGKKATETTRNYDTGEGRTRD